MYTKTLPVWKKLANALVNAAAAEVRRKEAEKRRHHEMFGLEVRARLKVVK